MRIIAGKYKRMKLNTLSGDNTRPMTDRMKESVFNIIGQYFNNDIVLDLFGGSGALSLESISRGAKHAYISEINRDAINIIKSNIDHLKANNEVTLLFSDYRKTIKRLENLKFDIVFLDPPYRMHIIEDIIDELISKEMIHENSLIVCHYAKKTYDIIDKMELVRNFIYGGGEVAIYKIKG